MCKIKNISDNPFARFSAEEEEDLHSIFFTPRYYDTLKSNAKQGNSRILVGQRGLGKSATIHMLFEDLKLNRTLPLLITRYEGIPLSNNKAYFLYKIIQSLTKRLAEHLNKHSRDIKLLSKEQKKQLSYFIEMFYDEEIAEDYLRKAKSIKKKKRNNWFLRLFNKNLKLLNSVATGITQITSSIVRQSMGLLDNDEAISPIAIFEEIPISRIGGLSIDEVAAKGSNKLLSILKILIDLALTLNYESIVVLFDKIDEFAEINADINKVTDFTLQILTDTDLLYTSKLSIVFSLWSEVKRTLNSQGVRFDKFQDIDISWRDDELEQLINKRLLYYSVDKNFPVTLRSLIPFETTRNTILKLAGGSPRSLISLMSRLYDEELRNNATKGDIASFSDEAISKGLAEFCKRFDYESLQPSKVSDKNNYYNWLNKILLMKKNTFSIADICSVFTIKATTAKTYINHMEKFGIISPEISEGDDTIYRTIDPRICYLMSRGITSLS